MNKNGFFFFFVRSISQRKGRVVIAALSVALAVGIITALAGITSGIRDKLGAELKAYGGNIIISPKDAGYLDSEVLNSIRKLTSVEDISGQVYGSALVNGHSLELLGIDIAQIKGKGWRLFGQWPQSNGEMIAGINLRDILKIQENKIVLIENSGRKKEFVVKGFIEKGGSEDSAVIVSIPDAWELLGINGMLSAVIVRSAAGKADIAVKEIGALLQDASVRTLRQVAVAEESLLTKIQLLMILVTVVVLSAAAISVGSTMGANVLERREEIGLMKALGAARRQIGLFYHTEALLVGFSGGTAGFILGYVSSQAISRAAFDSFIGMPWYLPFLSLITGVLISILASHFPVRNAMSYNPAVILRGE